MREKKTGHDIAKSINIFYFAIAIAVAFAIPGAYFLEDYSGEKQEVAAWAEVQSATVNRAIEENPDIWLHIRMKLASLSHTKIATYSPFKVAPSSHSQ